MTTFFYALALLACPVAMGMMMFMMRGQNKGSEGQDHGHADQGELDALRAEIAALKADCDAPSASKLPRP